MKYKINKILKNLRSKIVDYIITNRLFLSYCFLALIATIFVRKFTIGSFISLYPIITDLGIILILGSFGYLIKPKNQFKYFFGCLIFISFICMISSVYFHFFTSFASIGELATIGQTETVTGAIYDKLAVFDIMYVLGPILFFLIHRRLVASTYYYFVDKIENGKVMLATTMLVGSLLVLYSMGMANDTDYSRLNKQWNRLYIVERFGVLLYQTNDVVQFMSPKINGMFGRENAEELFQEYFADIGEIPKNKYTNLLKDKNIIFVHMESMQDFLMDLKFNGEEVTPNLNKLAKEGMFFSNFYPQVSTGTSSDTEFTLNSGLLPASSGTVFVSYYKKNYLTIPKFLSNLGYNTFSMHGNLASMWNRNKAHPSLGYKDMYFKESFTFTDEDVINLGINDRLFFEQAIPILEGIEVDNKNYMGTVITLSNHSPFYLGSEYSELDLSTTYVDPETEEVVITDYLDSSAVGEYIKSANYADIALGDFIKYIKESEYFNNTVFVFYGDHDAKLSRNEINYLYNLNPVTGDTYSEGDENYYPYDYYAHELNKKTPLIIWTKNAKLKSIFKGEVTYTMGMYNVAPTILNMFGLYNKYTVGKDIFTEKENNFVVLANGNVINDKIYYNNSTREYKNLTLEKVDKEYVENIAKEAEKRLEVSNAIIVYNLLKDVKVGEEE